jgi:plastocyanin
LTVSAGTALTWLNEDDAPHTVIGTDPESPIKSLPLDTGERYSITLTKPGTYRYFCSLHPHMTGTVIVEPRF